MKSSEVIKIAKSFGFDQAGVTSLQSLDEGRKAIEAWVREGRHGTMKYLEDLLARQKIFFESIPEAQSVIVLGVNYFSFQSSPETKTDKTKGRVARYAWGKDYHRVIAQRHQLLIEKLRQEFAMNFNAKSCVDIQPIPERFAAVQAGLGFIGKHTGLLSREFGPWLFLSEIVTSLDLEESLPAQGNCGSCVDCQKICPTGALDKDYQIDARLCIAYLTIEHKGVIEPRLRPMVKDWIFGCDECFDVCPFTSKSKESHWPELGSKAGVGPFLDIDGLFAIASNREFEEKFSGTALSRVSRKQMMRNACLVLGNSKNPEVLPYLKKAMADPAPLVRIHAAWALSQIPHPSAREILQSQLQDETDPEVLGEVQRSLERGV